MVRPLSITTAALGAAAFAAASLLECQAGSEACRDLHISLARGNNEPYPGRQGKLTGAICAGVESCDYEDIQFYNPLEAPYCGSVAEGAANGIKQIRAYNQRCPNSKLVVSGYSQVVAALVFGDTRHTAGQSYNYLDGSGKDGLFPCPGDQLAELNTFAGVLRSYCAVADPICAGGDVVEDHWNYFDVYSNDIGLWVGDMASKLNTPTTISSIAQSTITPASSTFTTTSSISIAYASSTEKLVESMSSDVTPDDRNSEVSTTARAETTTTVLPEETGESAAGEDVSTPSTRTGAFLGQLAI